VNGGDGSFDVTGDEDSRFVCFQLADLSIFFDFVADRDEDVEDISRFDTFANSRKLEFNSHSYLFEMQMKELEMPFRGRAQCNHRPEAYAT
jgi:hypothetical protein